MSSERFAFPRAELRRRTLRGAAVTAAFLVLIDGLVIAQGLVVTRVLGPATIGLYGIVSTTVITLVALKRIGIDEAFVAQSEADQEAEFQHAFTLDLAASAIIALCICASAPIIALVYGDDRLVALTLSLAYLPIAFALQAPLWIFFRRMDYARQRSLQAIQPVVSFVVTVTLVLATSLGVWSIVIGQVVSYVIAVGCGWLVSPYRPRLRWHPEVAARYLRFSTPIFVTVVATLVIAQGQVLAFKLHGGLAAAGFITLAVTLTRYIDRADQIVTATLYPAVCAIQGQARALQELFVKANRATLLWVMPFGAAVVLFAPDLVTFVLGPKWRPAVILLQGLAVAALLAQLGFNWFSFYRAAGRTGPTAVEALVQAGGFLALAIPGLIVDGSDGFVAGRILAVLLTLVVRARYVRALLPGVRYRSMLGPSAACVTAATVAVLIVRLAAWGGHRSLAQAIGECVLFGAVYAGTALWRERPLVDELRGALRPVAPGGST